MLTTVSQPCLWGFHELAAAPITARWRALDDTSSILHQPAWLRGADGAFDELGTSIAWRAERRPMYERVVDVPRLVAACRLDRLDTDHPVQKIARFAEAALEMRFWSAGLNLYRDGRDSVAWHGDRLPNRADSVVAIVSLGGPRDFRLRPAPKHHMKPHTLSLQLGSGDLLVMAGACQRDWQHCVPKAAFARPRISVGLRTRHASGGWFADTGR